MANYSKSKRFFSKKDDIAICKSFLEKGLLDEPALAEQLGRLPQNILYRWVYHILPSIKRGIDWQSDAFKEEIKLKIKEYENSSVDDNRRRFTKEEDQQILELAERFGKDWNLISEEMKTRSAVSIFHRYTSTLKPGLKDHTVPFTKEEDNIIREYMELKGKTNYRKWSYLSQIKLPSRSPNSIRYRWKILNTDASPITLDDYKKFVQSLALYGPDFVRISKEHFPKKDPLFLRNFWIHGLRRLVPEFFTYKWTREEDQKLIDCCMAKGFDFVETFTEDFPQIHDVAELNHRLLYLLYLIPPNQECAPSFPLDVEFERLRMAKRSSTQRKSDIAKTYNDLHVKYKIPKRLIELRKMAFNRVLEEPFSKEEDEQLIKLVKEALEKDPLGPFSGPCFTRKSSEKIITVEVEKPVLWSELSKQLKRGIRECRGRWNELKYNLYQ
jgi:hypothetical protein